MSARLFIRNDDVWTLDQEFRYFFDLAMDHGLPVVHAVIPGKMDQKLIRFLCRAKEKDPRLLDIVQHGWVHANHSVDTGLKYEFGPSRDYGFQHKDIRQGLKKMRLAFGEHFTPAFVPPYHGYDERTVRVLDEEGFQIFSAGVRRLELKKRMMELPAQVSYSRYEKDRTIVPNASEVLGILAGSILRRPLTGVVTHHADFKGLSLRKELERFLGRIAALGTKEGWRVILFSEIKKGNDHGSKRIVKDS